MLSACRPKKYCTFVNEWHLVECVYLPTSFRKVLMK